MSVCVCGVGPWSDAGVCESCGGTSMTVPNVTSQPRELSFITDDQICDRLRGIGERASAVVRDVDALVQEIGS